jgi:3-phenylpropionate/trans-cinnamate dioxygenase ferredoxin component
LQWIKAGAADSLPDGESMTVPAGRRMIMLVHSAGEYFAIEDICTHDGAELTGGAILGAEVVCPRHGARFCLRTGEALSPPAYEPVRVFKTKLEDGYLWVLAD